jgi:hypothetical protein
MAIEFVMLFTTINKTKRGMYTYICICSIIKLINEKKKKKKKKKTGEKIRSAGLLYSYVCLTNKNGVIANEDKKDGKTKTKYTKRRQAGHRRTIQILDRHCLLLIKANKQKVIYCVFSYKNKH